MKNNIQKVEMKFLTSQMTNKYESKYGHLPVKDAKEIPWNQPCTDLVEPYKTSINF